MCKRKTVTPEQSCDLRDRPGFVAVECYGSITPERNEVGGIFNDMSDPRIERGLWVQDAVCVERFFLEA